MKPTNRNYLITCSAAVLAAQGFFQHPARSAEEIIIPGQPALSLAEENIELSADKKVITIRAGEELRIPVFVLQQPRVPRTGYILKGDVRHEDVGGEGMLEMWNIFPGVDKEGNPTDGEGRFFSRTAGEVGPMRKLKGTSAWRPFILPFNTGKLGLTPRRLEINVLLPDGGTVMLRNLQLMDWNPPAPANQASTGEGDSGSPDLLQASVLGGSLLLATATSAFLLQSGKNPSARLFAKIGVGAMVATAIGLATAAFRLASFSWLFAVFSVILVVTAGIYFLILWRQSSVESELRRMSAADTQG